MSCSAAVSSSVPRLSKQPFAEWAAEWWETYKSDPARAPSTLAGMGHASGQRRDGSATGPRYRWTTPEFLGNVVW